MVELVRFTVDGTEIFCTYNNKYITYDTENFLAWLADRNGCNADDIQAEKFEVPEDDRELYIFDCTECGRVATYRFKGDEKRNLNRYTVYGNPDKRRIQDILPDMQPWLRESFISGGIGCVCPTCMENLR